MVGIVICESAIRIFIETNEDGQDFLFGEPLRPYRFQLMKTQKGLNRFINSDSSYVIYDSQLGWTHRKNGRSKNNLYQANADGIRSDTDYPLKPSPDVIRIALFGDSYTHSSEVSYQESWGFVLKSLLTRNGKKVEVINFGVGGYGMDQAYLRWKYQGINYQPDIVIFGFRAPDALRNVNVFRSIYNPGSGVPFSKPRFVIRNDRLELVNTPTIPIEFIIPVLRSFSEQELSKYEYFFDENYRVHWWQRSKLASAIYHFIAPNVRNLPKDSRKTAHPYKLDGEIGQLALAIIDTFANEVNSQGAKFLMVHLPASRDLKRLMNGENLVYSELLEKMDNSYAVAHPEDHINSKSLDHFEGHYSAEGNKITALSVFDMLEPLINSFQRKTE